MMFLSSKIIWNPGKSGIFMITGVASKWLGFKDTDKLSGFVMDPKFDEKFTVLGPTLYCAVCSLFKMET